MITNATTINDIFKYSIVSALAIAGIVSVGLNFTLISSISVYSELASSILTYFMWKTLFYALILFDICFSMVILFDFKSVIYSFLGIVDFFIDRFVYINMDDYDVLAENIDTDEFIKNSSETIYEIIIGATFDDLIDQVTDKLYKSLELPENLKSYEKADKKDIKTVLSINIYLELYYVFRVKGSSIIKRKFNKKLLDKESQFILSSSKISFKVYTYRIIHHLLEKLDFHQKIMKSYEFVPESMVDDINDLLQYHHNYTKNLSYKELQKIAASDPYGFYCKIKTSFNKAMITYHPDKAVSDEMSRTFNDKYNRFKAVTLHFKRNFDKSTLENNFEGSDTKIKTLKLCNFPF